VDDVEVAAGERQRQVGADADRKTDPAPARDRHGRPDRDHIAPRAVLQRAPPGEQVCRPVRGRNDADLVAAVSKRAGRAGDVFVHVMRLRPGEGRDEADPETHEARV
jgi:hypothetical protein